MQMIKIIYSKALSYSCTSMCIGSFVSSRESMFPPGYVKNSIVAFFVNTRSLSRSGEMTARVLY
jgi:hypothetical protein